MSISRPPNISLVQSLHLTLHDSFEKFSTLTHLFDVKIS